MFRQFPPCARRCSALVKNWMLVGSPARLGKPFTLFIASLLFGSAKARRKKASVLGIVWFSVRNAIKSPQALLLVFMKPAACPF